jgi:hypothetical protein
MVTPIIFVALSSAPKDAGGDTGTTREIDVHRWNYFCTSTCGNGSNGIPRIW